MCVLGYKIYLCFYDFLLGSRTVLTVWVFFFIAFHFIALVVGRYHCIEADDQCQSIRYQY